jgi:hypothetical protein
MKTILITCAAVAAMFASFEVYSISTPSGAAAGLFYAERTTANELLEEALSK